MDKFYDLIEKHLEPFLEPLWNNIVFWRSIALVIIGLMLLGYKKRRRLAAFILKDKYENHDKMVFERINAVLDESKLEVVFAEIHKPEFLDKGGVVRLNDFTMVLTRTENKFFTQSIQSKADSLCAILGDMTEVTWGIMQRYRRGEESKEKPQPIILGLTERDIMLKGMASKAQSFYHQFRQEVKDVLLV
jgi:hypothetical protein